MDCRTSFGATLPLVCRWYSFYALQIFLVTLPLTTMAFFFYEKRLRRHGSALSIEHRLFWMPFFSKTYQLRSQDTFEIRHFMDAPNMARMKSGPEAVGFQNKGYFTLLAYTENDQAILIDRHSRKVDLQGVMALLSLASH